MTYLLRLTEKRPDAAIDAALTEAIANAQVRFQPLQFEYEFPRTGYGITALTSKAISGTNQSSGLQGNVASSVVWGISSITTAGTWQDWINIPIDDRVYIIVTGVFNRTNTPRITNLRFKANGEDLPWVNLEEMYTWDLAQAYFQRPLIVSPTNNLTVRVLSDAAVTGASAQPGERIGLLGYQIAKRNFLISES